METQVKEHRPARHEMRNGTGLTVDEVRRRAGRVKRDFADTVDKRVHAAKRTVRKGVYSVQDGKAELTGKIRRAPWRSVMLSAVFGTVLGLGAAFLRKLRGSR